MPSHPSVSKFQTILRVSLGLAIISFGFDMACLGAYSFWLIPSAFILTVIHHIFLFRHLRRHPNRPHKVGRGLIYTLIVPILAWLAGAGVAFFIFYVVQLDFEHVSAQVAMTVVGGVVAVFEAGVLVEVWRRCLKMSKESEMLGVTDGISDDRSFVQLGSQKQDTNKQNASAV